MRPLDRGAFSEQPIDLTPVARRRVGSACTGVSLIVGLDCAVRRPITARPLTAGVCGPHMGVARAETCSQVRPVLLREHPQSSPHPPLPVPCLGNRPHPRPQERVPPFPAEPPDDPAAAIPTPPNCFRWTLALRATSQFCWQAVRLPLRDTSRTWPIRSRRLIILIFAVTLLRRSSRRDCLWVPRTCLWSTQAICGRAASE